MSDFQTEAELLEALAQQFVQLNSELVELRKLETLVKQWVEYQTGPFDVLASDAWDQLMEHAKGNTDE